MKLHSLADLIDEIDGLRHRTRESDTAYSRAKIEYIKLEGMRKTVFARIVGEMEGKSFAEKERLAHVNNTWVEWVTKYINAQVEMEENRVGRDSDRIDFDAVRTMTSTIKTELEKL